MPESTESPIFNESAEEPVYEDVRTPVRSAALADYTFENELQGPTAGVESILKGVREGIFKLEGRVLANLQKDLDTIGQNTPLYREALRRIAAGKPVPIRNLGSSSVSLSGGDLIDLQELRRNMEQSKQPFAKTGLAPLVESPPQPSRSATSARTGPS